MEASATSTNGPTSPPLGSLGTELARLQDRPLTIGLGLGFVVGLAGPFLVYALGAGKKPPVKLTVNGYTYRSTVATVDGNYMVGFNADHRAASGLRGGDGIDVEIEVDTQPRTVDVPAELALALDAEPKAKETFEKLSNSMKDYHVSQVTGAKTDETRQRRIEKSIAVLREGKPR